MECGFFSAKLSILQRPVDKGRVRIVILTIICHVLSKGSNGLMGLLEIACIIYCNPINLNSPVIVINGNGGLPEKNKPIPEIICL